MFSFKFNISISTHITIQLETKMIDTTSNKEDRESGEPDRWKSEQI